MITSTPLILASSSPRRLELLRGIGVEPTEIVAADIDEAVLPREVPRIYARRMARAKLEAVLKKIEGREQGACILAADTVVACGRRILPKAETDADVWNCLTLLSGRRHRVYTGVAVRHPEGKIRERSGESIVAFKRLTSAEIEAYVASREGLGKAGGYAIQGRAAALIKFMAGSYSNIVGLPLYELAQLLRE